jgi:hypothetical protein
LGTTVVAPVITATPATGAAKDGNDDLYEEPTPTVGVSNATVPSSADTTSPTSPTSSKGFKSILNKLKRRSRHESNTVTGADGNTTEKDNTGFIGGASLRASESKSHSSTTPSTAHAEASHTARPTDLGDVEPTIVPHVHNDRYSDISSLSSDDEDLTRGRPRAERLLSNDTRASSEFEEARDHFDVGLAPPPTFTSEVDKGRHGSPVRDSKFHEVGI